MSAYVRFLLVCFEPDGQFQLKLIDVSKISQKFLKIGDYQRRHGLTKGKATMQALLDIRKLTWNLLLLESRELIHRLQVNHRK